MTIVYYSRETGDITKKQTKKRKAEIEHMLVHAGFARTQTPGVWVHTGWFSKIKEETK